MLRIGTGGTQGDFVSVDPSDGALLLTQSNEILRISIPNGGFGPTTPEPTSLVLMGFGMLGLLALARRRRTTYRGVA